MLQNAFVKNMVTYELVSQAVVRQVKSSTGKTDCPSKEALLSAKHGVKMHLLHYILYTINGSTYINVHNFCKYNLCLVLHA